MAIILASQSPYRKAQLEALGLTFQAIRPKVDEDELKTRGPKDLLELTRFLAQAKAESVAADFPEAVIIGSDQLAELNGKRLDKPGNHEGAHAQLLNLQGRTHRLLTSVILMRGARRFVHSEVTTLSMRAMSHDEIDGYLYQDQPYDCAGSYKFERAGAALLTAVEGKDPSAIQGLPLIALCEGLRQLGEPLWRSK
jgi:septum formation protein